MKTLLCSICLVFLSLYTIGQETTIKLSEESGIQIWLPNGWIYEKGEAVSVNDPDSKILLMFYEAPGSKIEGTPVEYGQKVMGMMFKNYKEVEKPASSKLNGWNMTTIIGKGALHGDKGIPAKMKIIEISSSYSLYVIISGEKKDLEKLQPDIDKILSKISIN